MIKTLYKKRSFIALFFLLLFIAQLTVPTAVYALTGGPSQPEVQAFQPAGTSDMVDLFSGDFSYNIPLFELPGPNGGYPFNLSYQSGIGMDQEASWVGLGWSLNPGAITRQMRGIPDEFNGDKITTKLSINPSVTVGLGAGVNLEVFGADKGASLTIGFGVSHNTFKGIGYSIDASLGFSKSNGSLAGSSVGLGLTLDTKEGVSVNPSLTLGTKVGDFGLGVGYNSKSGLSNVSFSHDYVLASTIYAVKNSKKDANGNNEARIKTRTASVSQSSSLTLAHPGYTPQISMPMRSVNIAATFKAGGAWWGIFASPYVSGFYNEQWLKHDKKKVTNEAYGYLHYQEGASPHAVLDFNREKDGIVSKESPNLAIPSLSYDIYSVVGQGISAMYRPMRNDIGVMHDVKVESATDGGSAGVDIGPAAHVGVNLSANHAKSVSGIWSENNDMHSHAQFQEKEKGSVYEPWYFKVHGEPFTENTEALKAIGGEKPVRIELAGNNSSPNATTTLKGAGFSQSAPSNSNLNRERKPRNQVIQSFTNEQILNNGQEMLSQFKIEYLDKNGNKQPFNRANLAGHHTTAFTALTPEGLQYNYGIPAYNLTQEEVNFSSKKPKRSNDPSKDSWRAEVGNNGGNDDPVYNHSTTDQFLKRVIMPSYAHSYLLTSITGPDYVDVKNDGVTPDDLGYWVKFTYQKASDNYKWRDPFYSAHFNEGWKTDPRDDKASFIYGEKEIWYLAQAETKSHIAVFSTTSREDSFGAATKLQDSKSLGERLSALSEIKLFTRAGGEASPIKSVSFSYDYSLCSGVDNSSTGNGKLTLKELAFSYGNSARGKLNPYKFIYAYNPEYNIHAFDRWGNYKPNPSNDIEFNHDFPYTDQNPAKKDEIDRNASAWSLREISLPSGGRVIVDYEIDDYAYVQHKQAMQMMEIVDPEIASTNVPATGQFNLTGNTKVRFRLERPLMPAEVSDPKAEVLKYLDKQRKQIYFKLKINLRSPSEDFHEYVCGYADVVFNNNMGLEKDASGNYAFGYFELAKPDEYHPFSVKAWQHIRTNQPELANSGRKLKQTNSDGDRIKQIKSLGSIVAQVKQMFGGYNRFCFNNDWGEEVLVGKSWIRLNSPDKVKYGGGLRVRQITMKDDWTQNEEAVYGQVYEYTMQEGSATISSGVAAYEPMAGGDENPLRYAKKYTQSIPLRSDNNMFFEYPINETYFPGPQVGYRKVTVMSLAAASLAKKTVKNITLSDGKKLFPEGDGVTYGTTGMTVHEYFTAKEFPVITEETDKQNKAYKLPLTIPFIGSIAISKLSASQGYSIITNDMHGRPKMVSNYRQDRTGTFEPEPISWIKYNYAAEQKFYEQEQVFSLLNQFKTNDDGSISLLTPSDRSNSSLTKYTLGQENEFIMDMREFQDNAYTGGIRFNSDFLFVFIGVIVVPIPWPSISKTENQLRTAVTNKVIFKSGILESTEAFDGGSLVKTSNLKWDKLTGAPVLTLVNNNFNNPVYSWNIPAYSQYQGMGAAYQNIGLDFSIENVTVDPYDPKLYVFNTTISPQLLVPGDELLLYSNDGQLVNPIAKVVFAGDKGSTKALYSDVSLSATSYRCMIARSGYRNQLSVSAGSITALEDPSKPGAQVKFDKTIQIPQ